MKKGEKTYSFNKREFDAYLEKKKEQPKDDQFWEAGTLISAMQKVDTGKAFCRVHSRINSGTGFSMFYAQFSRVAAIIVIPLLILVVWSLIREDHPMPDELSYQEVKGPSGMRSKVVLPDGTQVWLNADSKIRYSIPFVRETREVELTGEAFLDVVKNPDSPLDVNFDGFQVRVLGTQFNVKAFPEEKMTEVVLKKGSILLKQKEDEGFEPVQMNPDQQWTYDKEKHVAHLNSVNAEKYTAWHNNRLIFEDTPMAEVATLLERWYGIDVEILDKELYKYKFTTIFDNEPLQQVIDLLQMSSPITIDYIPGRYSEQTGIMEKSAIKIRKRE